MGMKSSTAVEYLDGKRITDAKVVETWWQKQGLQQTASGYGKKLTTRYMLQIDGKRWHRVYTMQFSNAGSCYVLIGGQTFFIQFDSDITSHLKG